MIPAFFAWGPGARVSGGTNIASAIPADKQRPLAVTVSVERTLGCDDRIGADRRLVRGGPIRQFGYLVIRVIEERLPSLAAGKHSDIVAMDVQPHIQRKLRIRSRSNVDVP